MKIIACSCLIHKYAFSNAYVSKWRNKNWRKYKLEYNRCDLVRRLFMVKEKKKGGGFRPIWKGHCAPSAEFCRHTFKAVSEIKSYNLVMKRLYTHITDIAVTTKRWELSAPAANAAATEKDWIWSTQNCTQTETCWQDFVLTLCDSLLFWCVCLYVSYFVNYATKNRYFCTSVSEWESDLLTKYSYTYKELGSSCFFALSARNNRQHWKQHSIENNNTWSLFMVQSVSILEKGLD